MKVLKYVAVAALVIWAVVATILATRYSEDLHIEKYYHESTSKSLERSYEDYEELEVRLKTTKTMELSFQIVADALSHVLQGKEFDINAKIDEIALRENLYDNDKNTLGFTTKTILQGYMNSFE
jgi:hypothetical protein